MGRGWTGARQTVKEMMSMAHWAPGCRRLSLCSSLGVVQPFQVGRPKSIRKYLPCLAGEGSAVSLPCRVCGPKVR